MKNLYVWLAIAQIGVVPAASAGTFTLDSFEADDRPYAFDPLNKHWDTGDLLIAPIKLDGQTGGFVGKKDALIFPEVKVFGQTILPAVRDDTRTGLRLTSDIDLFAGVQLYADVSSGGYSAPVVTQLTPALGTPDVMRAGRFYSLAGSTALSSDTGYALVAPMFSAGLDVIAGGTADFTLEAALWPALDYTTLTTRNDLGRQIAKVFNLEIDLNAPNIADYIPQLELFDIPEFLLAPDNDDLYRKKLPSNPLQSFGELAIVNPISSRTGETPVVDAKAVSTSYTGDLFRAGLDIDGILTNFASGGVSYSGLQVDLEAMIGTRVTLGTAFYDILDVKYGLELGYRETSTVETNLEAMLEFYESGTSVPIDVMIRQGDIVEIASSFSVADWAALPELALLDTRDVDVKLQFTALTRDLTRALDLTLGDYMEVKAWQIGLDAAGFLNLAGVPDLQLGPLAHLKFDIAGEFASFNIFRDTVGTLRDDFDASTWAPMLFTLSAAPTLDAYFVETDIEIDLGLGGTFTIRGFGNLGRTDSLRQLGTTDAPATLADTIVIVATADGVAGTRTELAPIHYRDPGQLRTVTATGSQIGSNGNFVYRNINDPFSFTTLGGLVVPAGSSYELGAGAARRFKLLTLENDGVIDGEGYLGFHAPDPDGALLISGSGSLRFGGPGELSAGLISHGAGHTIRFDTLRPWQSNFSSEVNAPIIDPTIHSSNPGYYELEHNHGQRLTTRSLVARQQFNNAGTLIVDGSVLATDITALRNTDTGVVSVRNGAVVRLDGTVSGRTAIENTGLIEAVGDAVLTLDSNSIAGGERHAGLFRAGTGGDLVFDTDTNLFLQRQIDFHAGDGSTIDFRTALTTTTDTAVRLLIDAGATVLLNGLQSATGRVVVENDGVLDIRSGNVSFTASGGQAPDAALIAPVDLHNRGTVRVRQGAQLVFDVDIVNYANGGATLADGSWELLGANQRSSNLDIAGLANPSYAVIEMNVSEVFGKAEDFADLVFEEIHDPDTGQLVLSSDISELDTSLRNNAASVTLSGAANFRYFNTVRTNTGTLNLRNQHQFTTVSSYENRGGTTSVDSRAGLIVNGGLFVHGGSVSFSGNSELRVLGTQIDVGEGVMERRDIEVVGGMLDIQAGTLELGGLVGRSRSDGLLLNAGKSWIVREHVTVDPGGDELVTPGAIKLGLRTLNGVAGVVRNDARVVIDGAAASFAGFEESLLYQHGELSLRGGQVYESPHGYFRNAGTMELVNAQFHLLGDDNQFLNDGTLSIDAGSLLRADFVNLNTGSLLLDGVIDADRVRVANSESVSGIGILKSRELMIESGGELSLTGGTLIANDVLGSLRIEEGTFVVFAGAGEALLSGNFEQSDAGRLQLDWGSATQDLLRVAGSAALGGGVALNFLDGYVPEVGSSLEVLAATALFGAFDEDALVYDRSLGRRFSFRYGQNQVFIDVAASPVPAPAALPLFGVALLALMRCRRRRRDVDGGQATARV